MKMRRKYLLKVHFKWRQIGGRWLACVACVNECDEDDLVRRRLVCEAPNKCVSIDGWMNGSSSHIIKWNNRCAWLGQLITWSIRINGSHACKNRSIVPCKMISVFPDNRCSRAACLPFRWMDALPDKQRQRHFFHFIFSIYFRFSHAEQTANW